MNNTRKNAHSLESSTRLPSLECEYHTVCGGTRSNESDFDHINTMWESNDDFGLRPSVVDYGQDMTRLQPIESAILSWQDVENAFPGYATQEREYHVPIIKILPNPAPSLLTRSLSFLTRSIQSLASRLTRSLSYKRVGGIHFLRFGRVSISASRKRVESKKVEAEERLLRLFAYLIIWPAVAIVSIQAVEILMHR